MHKNHRIWGLALAMALILIVVGTAAAAGLTQVILEAKSPRSISVPANSIVVFRNFSDPAATPDMTIEASQPMTATITPAGGKAVEVPMSSKDMKTLRSTATKVGQDFQLKIEGAPVSLVFTNDKAMSLWVGISDIPAPATPVPAATSVAKSYAETRITVPPTQTVKLSLEVPANGWFLDGLGKGDVLTYREASGATFKNDTGAGCVDKDKDDGLIFCDKKVDAMANMVPQKITPNPDVAGQKFYLTKITNSGSVTVTVSVYVPATATTDASSATVPLPKVGAENMHIEPMVINAAQAQPNFLSQAWAWIMRLFGK